jgi:Tfp pilus assembly protein PilF
MNRSGVPSAIVIAVVSLLGASAAHAQLNTASAIRGKVVDESGQPIAGVAVELEFKGESRVKIVKKTVTDKKGGYIYSGLPPGPWVFHFAKAGYKPTQAKSEISLGGLSEIPPVTLETGADTSVAGAIGAAAAPVAGPAPAPGVGTDKAKELADKYTKAMAAKKAGANDEAEALLKELVAVVPGFAPAHQALASIQAARGDAAAAEASYRKVVELEPGAAVSYLALSNFLATAGRNDEAFAVLQEAAPRFPQEGLMQFALGAAAFNVGKTEEAQAAFANAVAVDPSNAEPYFYLGSLAVSRNDVPKAVEYLEKYVSLAPATAPNLGAAKAVLGTLKKK